MNTTAHQSKVLVVDDTATNRQILAAFLRKLGFDVIQAEDGARGVAIFQAERPDLVLMDVMMPVMDGYEATRRIKALSGDVWVPVIFLSALDAEQNLVAGLDAGGDDYLHKPINFVVLDAKLRSVLRTLDLQRRLDEERRRIKAITDTLSDGVIVLDRELTIEWANPALGTIFGGSPEAYVGRSGLELVAGEDAARFHTALQRLQSIGQRTFSDRGPQVVQGRRGAGEYFPLETTVTEMEVDGGLHFVAVVRDVTERERARATLEENARRLQRYHDHQEAEQALAQEIVQRQMLRKGLADAAVKHWVVPTASFSGDTVAAVRGPAGELFALLADATGHGLGAAISTIPVLSVFYSLAETGATLSRIVEEMNRQLLATMPIGRFVGATLLRIAADGGSAEAWIGGTPDTLLFGPDGQVKLRLRSTHVPLGVIEFDAAESAPDPVAVVAGDQFALFSDGLIEATDASEVQFGVDRLCAMLSANPAARRIDAVQHALVAHMGGRAPHDDVSLLLIDCAPS